MGSKVQKFRCLWFYPVAVSILDHTVAFGTGRRQTYSSLRTLSFQEQDQVFPSENQ